MLKPTLSTTARPVLTHSDYERDLLEKKPYVLEMLIEQKQKLKLKGYFGIPILEILADKEKRYKLEKSAIEIIKKLLVIERIKNFLIRRKVNEKDIQSVTQFVLDNQGSLTIEALTNGVMNIEKSLLERDCSSEEKKKELIENVIKLLSLEIDAKLERKLKPTQVSIHAKPNAVSIERELELLQASMKRAQEVLDRVAKVKHDSAKHSPSISPNFEEDSKQRPSEQVFFPQTLIIRPPKKRIKSAVGLDVSNQERGDNDSSTAHTLFPKV